MHYQDDGKHFGNRLREARLGSGLSQSELEELSGIPKARLSRYENGHVEPSIQTLARLARALNVSEASLLGDQRAILEDFFEVLDDSVRLEVVLPGLLLKLWEPLKTVLLGRAKLLLEKK